jgi:hypothetical protein
MFGRDAERRSITAAALAGLVHEKTTDEDAVQMMLTRPVRGLKDALIYSPHTARWRVRGIDQSILNAKSDGSLPFHVLGQRMQAAENTLVVRMIRT